jgi:hypothetical protein
LHQSLLGLFVSSSVHSTCAQLFLNNSDSLLRATAKERVFNWLMSAGSENIMVILGLYKDDSPFRAILDYFLRSYEITDDMPFLAILHLEFRMSKSIDDPIEVRLDRFRGGGHRFDAVVSESREDKALKVMAVMDSVKALLSLPWFRRANVPWKASEQLERSTKVLT